MQKKLQDRLSALARASQLTNKPRKLVTRSGLRVRGIHNSNRFPQPLPWETPEERTAIEALDASQSTVDLLSQPAVLQIPSEEGTFLYTPDIAVLRTDGALWVIECKPRQVLKEVEVRFRHCAIAHYLLGVDVSFIELPNESQPHAVVKDNLRMLQGRGGPVQYPRSKREEDRRLIATHQPNSFRKSHGHRRRAVRGGCPRRRNAAL